VCTPGLLSVQVWRNRLIVGASPCHLVAVPRTKDAAAKMDSSSVLLIDHVGPETDLSIAEINIEWPPSPHTQPPLNLLLEELIKGPMVLANGTNEWMICPVTFGKVAG